MNENELCYRRVIGSIGGTMLLFLGLINAVGLLLGFLSELLLVLPVTETVYNLTYQLIYGAGYLASFMIPVALLRRLIGRAGYAYRPMELSLNGVKWLPLIVLAGIAVVRSTAYINAEMVSFLDYLGFSSEVVWVSDTPAAYELILEFIVLCVVPGVCEEFLFRGAIQTNLRLPTYNSGAYPSSSSVCAEKEVVVLAILASMASFNSALSICKISAS